MKNPVISFWFTFVILAFANQVLAATPSDSEADGFCAQGSYCHCTVTAASQVVNLMQSTFSKLAFLAFEDSEVSEKLEEPLTEESENELDLEQSEENDSSEQDVVNEQEIETETKSEVETETLDQVIVDETTDSTDDNETPEILSLDETLADIQNEINAAQDLTQEAQSAIENENFNSQENLEPDENAEDVVEQEEIASEAEPSIVNEDAQEEVDISPEAQSIQEEDEDPQIITITLAEGDIPVETKEPEQAAAEGEEILDDVPLEEQVTEQDDEIPEEQLVVIADTPRIVPKYVTPQEQSIPEHVSVQEPEPVHVTPTEQTIPVQEQEPDTVTPAEAQPEVTPEAQPGVTSEVIPEVTPVLTEVEPQQPISDDLPVQVTETESAEQLNQNEPTSRTREHLANDQSAVPTEQLNEERSNTPEPVLQPEQVIFIKEPVQVPDQTTNEDFSNTEPKVEL